MSDERRRQSAEAARDPEEFDRDLRKNRGIGQSKGAHAMGDLDYAEGENTVEENVKTTRIERVC